ncbi:MAG TPA: hypothetical protein VKZ98_06520 [Aquaticitalea sp.]|nr:hypothetical protein [Aquaticitalea sp.]
MSFIMTFVGETKRSPIQEVERIHQEVEEDMGQVEPGHGAFDPEFILPH